MNAAHNQDFGFDIVSPDPTTRARAITRFRCVECHKTMDLTLPPDNFSPHTQAKRAERHGWKADARRKNLCFCPKCSGPRKPKAATKTIFRSEFSPMPTPAPTQPATVAAIKPPTTDQRLAIRGHLDKSFDDAVGGYLDGLSDQRVAELVGVPRIIVEQIREAAYGAIRVDPVVVEMRQDLATLKVEIAGQQKALDTLKSTAATMSSRLDKALGA